MTISASFGLDSTIGDVHKHTLSEDLESGIESCLACYHACREAASYVLKMGGSIAERPHVELLTDCAEICRTCADFMIRGSRNHALTCRTCAEICQMCAVACDYHAADAFMKECAHICRSCALSCAQMSHH